MQYNALMDESLCYKMIQILYHSFLESVFFRIFANSIRAMSAMLKGIISYSESRRLFISTCSEFRGNMPHFTSAPKLSARKGVIKYAASAYRDSYIFRLINKKI